MFLHDPINEIHWDLAWVPKVPMPRQLWSFYRSIRAFAKGRPDLPKPVPGVAWQVRTCPAADCSTVMASPIS